MLDASCSKEATRYVDEMLNCKEKIVAKIPIEGVNIKRDDNEQPVIEAEDAMELCDDGDDAEPSDLVFDPICLQAKGHKKGT